MNENPGTATIRLMKAEDFDAVVAIDEKVLKTSRPAYYKQKFEMLFESADYVPTSLVAETADGRVVGFVMGKLFMGEFGIFQEEASLDTIGVDPDFQKQGIGEQLINAFIEHLKSLDVHKINTLVDWDNFQLINFFSSNRFVPSKTIYLERKL